MDRLLRLVPVRDIGRKRSDKLLQQLVAERSASGVEPDHVFWYFERGMDIQPPKAMHKKYPFALPDAVTATSCMCTYNATGRHSFADMRVDDSCAVLAQPLGSVKVWIAFRPEKLGKRALKRDDEFYKSLVKTMMWESGAPCEGSIPDTEKSTVNPTKSSAKWPPHIVRGHGPVTYSQFTQAKLPENGIYIACTEDNQGLYLPPGYKHIVYTLRGEGEDEEAEGEEEGEGGVSTLPQE